MTARQPTNIYRLVGADLPAMTAHKPTIPQLTKPNPTVGAGLLAKASIQPNHHQLTHRIREQARSHRVLRRC